MAAITIAGENLIAEKQAAQEVLVVSKFLYALVPGLDPDAPVDRYEGKPPADQMMYETDITKGGYVNPNQVVYSSMIGSNVGDWDFNWLGLETAEGVLLAAAYMPVQQKRKNIPNQQIGNNITRNMLLVFDGAQSVTELTINADTWQADFTVRMAGIDERERLSNRDMFGRACFFGDSLALVYQNEQFTIQPGTAYVEGLAVNLPAGAFITPPAYPFTLWYDISLQGQLSDVKVVLAASYGDDLVDFADTDGALHYLVPVATVLSSTDITDLRSTIEPIAGPLIQHLAARSGDYSGLRARATTKADVDLGNLPNAKSDDPDSNDSEILATTAALHAVKTAIEANLDALGTAAYLDAQIDLDDTAADALMKVGAFGLGGAGISLVAGTDLNTIRTAGFYRIEGTPTHGPAGVTNSVMIVGVGRDVTLQLIIQYNTGVSFTRGGSGSGSTWSAWKTQWDSGSLVKQSSAWDATAGRVLLNGAFGVGGVAPNLPGNDFNAAQVGGTYTFVADTLNRPDTPGGDHGLAIHVERSFGNLAYQEARVANSPTHYRYRTGDFATGTWGDWQIVWDSSNLEKQYSASDDSAGRVLLTGAYGWGQGGIEIPEGTDLDTITAAGVYRVQTAPDYPEGVHWSPMLVMVGQDTIAQMVINNQTGTIYSRGCISGGPGWGPWVTNWNSTNFNPGAYQPSLGFTPVQQGTGINQISGSIVKIGWAALGQLYCTVDALDLGAIWTDYYGVEKVRNAIVGFIAGHVGSYGMFRVYNGVGTVPGTLVAGGNLIFTDAGAQSSHGNPGGTWMLMGGLQNADGTDDDSAVICLRVA